MRVLAPCLGVERGRKVWMVWVDVVVECEMRGRWVLGWRQLFGIHVGKLPAEGVEWWCGSPFSDIAAGLNLLHNIL